MMAGRSTITASTLWLAVAAACLIAGTPAWAAESRGSGFQFLEEPVTPRLVAMGSAGTGMVDGGFFYYNPAAAYGRGQSTLSLQYGQQSGDLSRGALEATFGLRNWFVGLAIPTTSIKDIIPATEQGPEWGIRMTAQGTQIAMVAGYSGERYAVGLCGNLLQDRIATSAQYGFSLSLGGLFWIIPNHLSVGLAAFHPNKIAMGSGGIALSATRGATDQTEAADGSLLPSSERLGVAWTDSLKGIAYTAVIDAVLRNDDNRVMVPVGIEMCPVKFLAVRLGKRFNHDTEIMNLGLGLRLDPVSVDAAFVVSKLVDDADFKWSIGMTYVLDQLLAPKKSTEQK